VAVGRVLWLSNGVDMVGSVPWALLVHAAPPRHPLSVRADREIAGICKGLATCVAPMRLVARMRADVHCEIAGLCEGVAACVAPMRLVANMRADVPREVAGPSEGVATGVTREGSFSRMYSNVHGKVTRLYEGLSAGCAFVHARLLRCRSGPTARWSNKGHLARTRGPSVMSTAQLCFVDPLLRGA
jgi:hypothetical protein